MSGHPARPRAARRLAFAVAAMLFISQAQADIVILSSRAAAYKAGQELNDGHTLSLASGESVTVLLPSNAVREVSGPFSGTVADLGQGRPSGGRELWTLIKGYFTTGGVDESQVAATRAFAPIPAPPKAAIPWNAIPLGKSGIYCVASGEPASVARKETGAAQSVKLATKSMTQIADITFAEGSAAAEWPAAVPIENDAGYRFIMAGRPPVEFTLKVLEKADFEGPEVLAALYGKGCKDQIEAWLKSAGSKQ